MATIMVDDSENLEKAITRFKRMVEKEGIIREYKKREYFEKPSATLHQKKTTLERKLLNKRRKSEKKDYQSINLLKIEKSDSTKTEFYGVLSFFIC